MSKPYMLFVIMLAGCTNTYQDCILDRAPAAETDAEAKVVRVYCQSRYDMAPQGSGRGFVGYDSGQDCLNDKGDGIKSPVAFMLTRAACHSLYDPPKNPFDQFQ